MSVEIIEVNSCKRNLIVEVPEDEINELVEKRAREYARQAKVPGFRPGKVPLNIIKQRFGSDLVSDARQEVIRRYWKQAVAEYDLKPLAEPVVEDVKGEPGKELKFTVSFEVLPEIEIKDYTGVPVTLPSRQIEEADIDKSLEDLREQRAQFVPVEEGEIGKGHLVTITLDGVFEGGGKPLHEEDVTLMVGGAQTHEAFTENLLGRRTGETPSFDITYPAEYHQKRFAGKTVHYQLEIKDIKEKQLPDLDDDFAGEVGADNLGALRDRVREDLVTKAREVAEEKARIAALDEVVRRQTFDIPEAMVHEELETHAQRIAANLAQRGIDVTKTSIDWREVFKEEHPRAEMTVRRQLVLDSIAKRENLEVTEEELDKEFQKLSQIAAKPAAVLRAQFEKDKRIQQVRDHLRQNKALDFIYRNANISEG